MEIRSGSPSDAEAIARLIASFQGELTDDPFGAGAEGYLASVSAQAEREYLTSPRYRYLLAYAGPQLAGFISIETVPTYFTSSSSVHTNAKASLAPCGSEHCTSWALQRVKEFSQSTQALRPCRSTGRWVSFLPGQQEASMASRSFPCSAEGVE